MVDDHILHNDCQRCVNRGSYMSAHVLLNLLNEFRKSVKVRGLPSICSLFRIEFNAIIQEHEC